MIVAELGVEHIGDTVRLWGYKRSGKYLNTSAGILTSVSHGEFPGHTAVRLSGVYITTKESLNTMLGGTLNGSGNFVASGTKSTWSYDTVVEIIRDASELN